MVRIVSEKQRNHKNSILIIYLFTVNFFFPEQSENKHMQTEKVSSLRVKFLKILLKALKENHQKFKKKKKSGVKKSMVDQGVRPSSKCCFKKTTYPSSYELAMQLIHIRPSINVSPQL